jgi:hypothetical protein
VLGRDGDVASVLAEILKVFTDPQWMRAENRHRRAVRREHRGRNWHWRVVAGRPDQDRDALVEVGQV